MADGAILLAILHVLQGYAAHISKSTRRQITDTLAVAKGNQTKPNKAKATRETAAVRETRGSGKASRGSPPSNRTPACASQCPIFPLATTAPCQPPEEGTERVLASRLETEINRLRPTTAEKARRPAGLLCELGRREGARGGDQDRAGSQVTPVRGTGTPKPHGRRSRLAGEPTLLRVEGSALQPLPPHSPALGFLFRCLSVTRLYGDRIRPLAPAARALYGCCCTSRFQSCSSERRGE